jgi:phage repressor protein C with HTH and peptisase S24 domain
MNWGELIEELLKEFRTSTYELQNKYGINSATISNIRNGKSRPTQKVIKDLERAFNIRINDATPNNITYSRIVPRPSEEMKGTLPVQMIPVLATVYAGEPEFLHTEITDQEMPALNLIPGHRYYGLIVSGKSMETTLRDGDKIVVDMDAPLEDGCLVAVKLKGGQQYVKRYYNLNYAFVQLSSDNKDYGVRLIDKNDIAACHRVVSVYFSL